MTAPLAEIKARQDQWSTVTPVCIHEDIGWLIAEVELLKELVESLQPEHHYMTKMGAELQVEVSRQHEEIKRLKAIQNSSSHAYDTGMERAAVIEVSCKTETGDGAFEHGFEMGIKVKNAAIRAEIKETK